MRFIQKKRGSTIVSVLFEFIIFMALLGMFIALGPLIVNKFNVDHFTKTLVSSIETSGSCSDAEVNNIRNNLGAKLGLNPSDITIDITVPHGYHHGSACTSSPAHTAAQKIIQLKNPFSVTVSYPVEVKTFLPSLDGEMTKTVTLTKTLPGLSQVYCK